MAEVKVGKKAFEVKPLGLTERAELNDTIQEKADSLTFSDYVDVVKRCTNYSDEEINELTTDDIQGLAVACVNSVNKKK
jgi:hypothetical protein